MIITIEANQFKSITYINYQVIKVFLFYSLLGHLDTPRYLSGS